ncbi:MAG: hypothetical protein JWP44_5030 [Mucilaginibacter sp.]|nr:hypothetical protein [Mucilaginibacter sp.]
MKKLTFKEYYESKEQLLLACKDFPKIISEYIVKKYCKVPIVSEDDTDYIALKPKDTVKILWEFQDVKGIPQAKHIVFNNEKYLPTWNNKKLKQWVDSMTLEKGK